MFPLIFLVSAPYLSEVSFSYYHWGFSSKDTFVFPWCAYRQFSVPSATLVCFVNIFFSLGTGSHCTGWPGTHNSVSSASYMLGFQVCTTIPSLNVRTFTCPFCLNETILKDSIDEMCIQCKSIPNWKKHFNITICLLQIFLKKQGSSLMWNYSPAPLPNGCSKIKTNVVPVCHTEPYLCSPYVWKPFPFVWPHHMYLTLCVPLLFRLGCFEVFP